MSFTRAAAFAATLFVLHQLAAGQQPALGTLEQSLQSPAADPNAALGYVGFEPDEDIADNKGVHVKGVRPGTPADQSGLKKGDVIVNIDGRQIRNLDDYDSAVARPIGSKLVFVVERAGRSQSLAVTLGKRPPAVATSETPPSDPPSTSPSLSAPGPAAPGPSPSLSSPGSSSPGSSLPSSTLPSPTAPGASAPGLSAPGLSAPGLQPPSSFSAPSAPETSPRGGGITAQPLDSPRSFESTNPLPSPGTSTLPAPGPSSFPGSSAPPSATAAPSTSSGGSPSLGIRVINSDAAPGVARTHRGAYVERVNAGSPAAAAGVPVGAVIVGFDGRMINSDNDLVAAIRESRPGQEIELSYYDSTDRFAKKFVRLGEAGAPPAAGAFSAAPAPADGPPPRPGFGSNRPLLNRVENLARGSGLIPPAAVPSGTSTVYDPLVMAALQKSVAELTATVNALEARLQVLEGRRGGGADNSSPAPLGSPGFSSPAPSFGSPQTPGFGAPAAPTTPGFGAPTTPPGPSP